MNCSFLADDHAACTFIDTDFNVLHKSKFENDKIKIVPNCRFDVFGDLQLS